jgi:hypothetical protein
VRSSIDAGVKSIVSHRAARRRPGQSRLRRLRWGGCRRDEALTELLGEVLGGKPRHHVGVAARRQ